MKNLRSALLLLAFMASPAALAQDSDLSEPALTIAESCHAACERDFAICGDEGASAEDGRNGRTSTPSGASQMGQLRCKNTLSDCLKTCKGL